ncbi:hypothetical protein N665_0085s0060 [Sinapis alba]|nr:hypothetical protein N665_0085s0060 [Sinapis alba]
MAHTLPPRFRLREHRHHIPNRRSILRKLRSTQKSNPQRQKHLLNHMPTLTSNTRIKHFLQPLTPLHLPPNPLHNINRFLKRRIYRHLPSHQLKHHHAEAVNIALLVDLERVTVLRSYVTVRSRHH